jgi:hypothetical protein
MWAHETYFSQAFLKKIDEVLKDARERYKRIQSVPKREAIEDRFVVYEEEISIEKNDD